MEMEFVATTFKNLEPLLIKELEKLGATVERVPKRAVVCSGSKEVFYRCLYNSRLALRMLVPIAKFKIGHEKDLYHEAKQVDWAEFMNVDQYFSIVASVHSDHFNHTKYPIYRLKDAICDYFVDKNGERPSVSVNDADIVFHLRISEDFVTVSMDASGIPLFKRGYKKSAVDAPLNEVLASAMIMNTPWENETLLDPMCGSGTIITEAMMIQNNIPAQYFREDFAMFYWRGFDEELWNKVKEETPFPEKLKGKFFARDEDPRAIDSTESNLKNMKLVEFVDLELDDFFHSKAPAESGTIIFNPPYDERMELEDAASFYRAIGDHLKEAYKGWSVWIFTANFDALRKIGMKPSKKVILYNGPLECRLHRYDIYNKRITIY